MKERMEWSTLRVGRGDFEPLRPGQDAHAGPRGDERIHQHEAVHDGHRQEGGFRNFLQRRGGVGDAGHAW